MFPKNLGTRECLFLFEHHLSSHPVTPCLQLALQFFGFIFHHGTQVPAFTGIIHQIVQFVSFIFSISRLLKPFNQLVPSFTNGSGRSNAKTVIMRIVPTKGFTGSFAPESLRTGSRLTPSMSFALEMPPAR